MAIASGTFVVTALNRGRQRLGLRASAKHSTRTHDAPVGGIGTGEGPGHTWDRDMAAERRWSRSAPRSGLNTLLTRDFGERHRVAVGVLDPGGPEAAGIEDAALIGLDPGLVVL